MTEQLTENALLGLKSRIRGAARARDFNKVGELWKELLSVDEDVDHHFLIEMADEVAKRGDKEQAGRLLFEVMPKLEDQGDPDEVFAVIRKIARFAPRIPELRDAVLAQYRRVHGAHPGLEAALKRTGLLLDGPLDEAVKQLDNAFYFKIGDYIVHRRGWGIGKVVEALPDRGEFVIDFHRRPGHRMAAAMARKTLDRKEPDDFEVLLWVGPEQLQEMSVEEPLAVIKSALRAYGGKMVARDLRERLSGEGKPLTKGEWTKFWSKARRLAIQDSMIEIGPSPKCAMELRDTPVSREDEVSRKVHIAANFHKRLKICFEELNRILDARKKSSGKADEIPTWIAPAMEAMEKDLKRSRKKGTAALALQLEFELFKAHIAAVFTSITAELKVVPYDPDSDDSPEPESPEAADPTAADPTAAEPSADPTADPTAAAPEEKPAPEPEPTKVSKTGNPSLTVGVIRSLRQVEDIAELMRAISIDNYRRRTVSLMRYAFPKSFIAQLEEVLKNPPLGLFDNVAEELKRSGAVDVVKRLAEAVYIKPKDFPAALNALSRGHFSGRLKDLLPKRSDYEVLLKHLQVLDDLAVRQKGEQTKDAKVQGKTVFDSMKSMLSERSLKVFKRVIEAGTEDQARRMLIKVRQSPAVTRTVISTVESLVAKSYPSILASLSKVKERKDEDAFLIMTKTGIARLFEERRKLLEEDIPKNRKDLGEALEKGDISENAELDEARREQERLSNRLEGVNREISRVQEIDFSKLSGEKVEVGVGVKARNVSSGEVHTWTILGPRDADEARGYISYMSPVGAGLMGHAIGQKATISLPDGSEATFELLEISIPDPDSLFQ